jgi:hypothetical protein
MIRCAEPLKVRFDTIAANIADIVNQVPDEIRLRIVLTTDHGRLLADSETHQDQHPLGWKSTVEQRGEATRSAA